MAFEAEDVLWIRTADGGIAFLLPGRVNEILGGDAPCDAFEAVAAESRRWLFRWAVLAQGREAIELVEGAPLPYLVWRDPARPPAPPAPDPTHRKARAIRMPREVGARRELEDSDCGWALDGTAWYAPHRSGGFEVTGVLLCLRQAI